MKNNYFIIHGSFGSPEKHWLPWLKNTITNMGYECFTPTFPIPPEQIFSNWEKVLDEYLENGKINENSTIITHSLGGIFTVKYLLKHNIKIKKLITVAGFNNLKVDDENLDLENFYVKDEELSRIRDLVSERYSIYSKDDPEVPFEVACHFAEEIGAVSKEVDGRGHFTRKSGCTELEEILEFIEN